MWRITAADMSKLGVFHKKCMRKIQQVFWPNQISNEELCKHTNTLPLAVCEDKDTEMEMDWSCPAQRWQYHHQKCTDLGSRRKKKTGQTMNDLKEECREREWKEGWQSWGATTACARDRDGCSAFLNGLRCPAYFLEFHCQRACNNYVCKVI